MLGVGFWQSQTLRRCAKTRLPLAAKELAHADRSIQVALNAELGMFPVLNRDYSTPPILRLLGTVSIGTSQL